MTPIQYIIRDVATGCHYTGGYQTQAAARRGAHKLIAKYGRAVWVVATDGREEQNIEQIDEGAWR